MKLYLFSLFLILLFSISSQQGVSYGNGGSTGYGGSGGGSSSSSGGSGGSGGSGNLSSSGGSGGSANLNNDETTIVQESGETTTIPESGETVTTIPENGETATTIPESGESGVVIQESGEGVFTLPENGETVTAISENGETEAVQEFGETGVVISESGETGEAGGQPQTTTPVSVFPPSTLDTFIVDFHYLSGRGLSTSHPSFHYCFELSPGFTQCDLYNGTDSNSRLLGVEMVVTLDILKTFDVEERKLWYPHAFEILNGFVVIPNLSPDQELEVMKVLVNTYAKTIAFYPQDPNFPIGAPQLAFGWQTDQQVNTTLARELDQFLNLTTTFEERAKARQGLVTDQLLEGLNSWMTDGESPQFQVFTISVDTNTDEP